MTLEELTDLENYKKETYDEVRERNYKLEEFQKLRKRENLIMCFGIYNTREYGDYDRRYCLLKTYTYLDKDDSKKILDMIIEQYKLESDERLRQINETHGF